MSGRPHGIMTLLMPVAVLWPSRSAGHIWSCYLMWGNGCFMHFMACCSLRYRWYRVIFDLIMCKYRASLVHCWPVHHLYWPKAEYKSLLHKLSYIQHVNLVTSLQWPFMLRFQGCLIWKGLFSVCMFSADSPLYLQQSFSVQIDHLPVNTTFSRLKKWSVQSAHS